MFNIWRLFCFCLLPAAINTTNTYHQKNPVSMKKHSLSDSIEQEDYSRHCDPAKHPWIEAERSWKNRIIIPASPPKQKLRDLFLPYNRQFTGFHRLTNNRSFRKSVGRKETQKKRQILLEGKCYACNRNLSCRAYRYLFNPHARGQWIRNDSHHLNTVAALWGRSCMAQGRSCFAGSWKGSRVYPQA